MLLQKWYGLSLEVILSLKWSLIIGFTVFMYCLTMLFYFTALWPAIIIMTMTKYFIQPL